MDGIKALTLLLAGFAGLLFPRIQGNANCVDDITVNCTMLDALFHVCSGSKEHAALVCAQTCNLCNYVNGKWTEWSDWSACMSTCGNATQIRERSCTNPKPSKIGKDCEGPAEEYNPCKLEPCPVDGTWSDWAKWSACRATCGSTTQTRSRTCTNPPPSNNGTDCEGSSEESKSCMLEPCPVDGKWSDWATSSACTTTCGSSTQTRSRTCTNPPPSINGRDCEGSSEESKSCMLEPCPVRVGWRTWGEWGSCSSTCGVGIQNRNRSCVAPLLNRVGDYCIGDTTDHQICMPRACSDGEWVTWSSWSDCSVTCGVGFQQRARDCTNPPPSPYGRWCTGPSSDVAFCNTQPCPQAVRLVSGRLEILLNGQWGTVCRDFFNENNNGAQVACRMLGLHTSNARYVTPGDEPSSMRIWLDDVICNGHEKSLLECSHHPVGVHNCDHSEDAGVSCG